MSVTDKKTRKKRSRIWLMEHNEFSELVKNNTTYASILRILNYSTRGAGNRMLKSRIQAEGIDDTHIKLGKYQVMAQLRSRPDHEVFVENSTYLNGVSIKRRLINQKYKENVCSVCGLLPKWNNKVLSLQIDHINGVRTDNRLENLRLICPNCHSQTDNFAGKNRLNVKRIYCECGKRVSGYKANQKCSSCASTQLQYSKRKIERPNKQKLEELLWEKPTTHIAKEYGVSDKAVEKWSKIYGISKPPRGYWQKINSSL